MPAYLFLAVPNFCGSTLLHSLLETCPSVVPLTPPKPLFNGKEDFVEGNCCCPRGGYRQLSGPHSIEANMEHVYADPANYDWPLIKAQWDANWEKTNPSASLRMQKTPADIFRVPMILPHFDPLHWIIMVRNPYSHVESIMRKATWQMEPLRQLDQVCHHALRCLEVQMENVALLGEGAYTMTYEDFIARPEFHREALGRFLPELEAIRFDVELWVKGAKVTSIHDDSAEKLARLVGSVPDIIPRINAYFAPYRHVLEFWGYSLLEADGLTPRASCGPVSEEADIPLEAQVETLTAGFERSLQLLSQARQYLPDVALRQVVDQWLRGFDVAA